ncbi:MAG: isoprenylcysteine carboxylmethyltransferase family protein [Bacteriovoracia bacterium]
MSKLSEFYRRELRGKLRVWLSWILLPIVLGTVRQHPQLFGILVLAFGTILRVWASGCLDKESKLAFNGPYHFSRNPLYLGSILIGVAIPLSQELWLLSFVILVATWLIHIAIIREEEKVLKEKFADYPSYMARVPRFFSPMLFIQELLPRREPREGIVFNRRLWLRNKGWEPILVSVALLGITYLIAEYRAPVAAPAATSSLPAE